MEFTNCEPNNKFMGGKLFEMRTEKFLKNTTALQVLQLCVGAQVMLLVNLNVNNKLANGSRGGKL